MTNFEAVVEALGFRLHLLGVFQHPLVENKRLTPLLHQHVGLSDEEAPERGGVDKVESLFWVRVGKKLKCG